MLLIEQIHYATTSRYNFPQPLENTAIPKKLIELSLSSMSRIKERYFQPWVDSTIQPTEVVKEPKDLIEIYGKDSLSIISSLEPIPDDTPVIAVDVSSIRVGETESGVICAVRGAVVWKERKHYRFLRLGPFPFHITEDNWKEIVSFLGHGRLVNFSTVSPFLIEVQSRLSNALERWIQTMVSASVSNSIILLDGSLASGVSNIHLSPLVRILRAARENSNIVLSFSKASTVKFLGRKITDLIVRQKAPCLLEIDERMLSISSKRLRLLGRIYVAKLNNRGYPFRVDIDKALPKEIQIMAVQRLLGNELTFQGYPETLRLAHIFSTFTANDVIGIQRFITKEYGLKVVTWLNIRKALFGPFGTGGIGD